MYECVQTPCRLFALWSVFADTQAQRSRRRNPPSHPPFPLNDTSLKHVTVSVFAVRRASFHLHTWIRQDTAEEGARYLRASPRRLCTHTHQTWPGVSHTHRHKQCQSWLAGRQLLPSELHERRKSPKKPQARPLHCYYQAFLFLQISRAPSKRWKELENDNYQEGGV